MNSLTLSNLLLSIYYNLTLPSLPRLIHYLSVSKIRAPGLSPCSSFISRQVSELSGVNSHEAGKRDVIIQSAFSLSCKLSALGEWEMMES